MLLRIVMLGLCLGVLGAAEKVAVQTEVLPEPARSSELVVFTKVSADMASNKSIDVISYHNGRYLTKYNEKGQNGLKELNELLSQGWYVKAVHPLNNHADAKVYVSMIVLRRHP